jgi:hypothetical protein
MKNIRNLTEVLPEPMAHGHTIYDVFHIVLAEFLDLCMVRVGYRDVCHTWAHAYLSILNEGLPDLLCFGLHERTIATWYACGASEKQALTRCSLLTMLLKLFRRPPGICQKFHVFFP